MVQPPPVDVVTVGDGHPIPVFFGRNFAVGKVGVAFRFGGHTHPGVVRPGDWQVGRVVGHGGGGAVAVGEANLMITFQKNLHSICMSPQYYPLYQTD